MSRIPERWGRRMVIGGAGMVVAAWVGFSVAIFKYVGG